MKKQIVSLSLLATVFALASCVEQNNKPTASTSNKNDLDYSVTAFTPKGDTAWVAVADEIYVYDGSGSNRNSETMSLEQKSTITPGGIVVKDKETGQVFAASNNYVVKSIPAIKP